MTTEELQLLKLRLSILGSHIRNALLSINEAEYQDSVDEEGNVELDVHNKIVNEVNTIKQFCSMFSSNNGFELIVDDDTMRVISKARKDAQGELDDLRNSSEAGIPSTEESPAQSI